MIFKIVLAIISSMCIKSCSQSPIVKNRLADPQPQDIDPSENDPNNPPDNISLTKTLPQGLGISVSGFDAATPPPRKASDPLAPGNEALVFGHCFHLFDGNKSEWPAPEIQNINFSSIDKCLETLSKNKITMSDNTVIGQKTLLDIPGAFLNPNGEGSEEYPFAKPLFPGWMDNDEYRGKFSFEKNGIKHYYWGIKYGGKFKQALIEYMKAAGARYANDDRIGVVRLYLGFQGEVQPISGCASWWPTDPSTHSSSAGCPDDTALVTKAMETSVSSCEDYIGFLRDVTEAAAKAFPKHPVLAMSLPFGGSCMSAQRWRKEFFTYFKDKNILNVGLSHNGTQPDHGGAEQRLGNKYTGWNVMDSGKTP